MEGTYEVGRRAIETIGVVTSRLVITIRVGQVTLSCEVGRIVSFRFNHK